MMAVMTSALIVGMWETARKVAGCSTTHPHTHPHHHSGAPFPPHGRTSLLPPASRLPSPPLRCPCCWCFAPTAPTTGASCAQQLLRTPTRSTDGGRLGSFSGGCSTAASILSDRCAAACITTQHKHTQYGHHRDHSPCIASVADVYTPHFGLRWIERRTQWQPPTTALPTTPLQQVGLAVDSRGASSTEGPPGSLHHRVQLLPGFYAAGAPRRPGCPAGRRAQAGGAAVADGAPQPHRVCAAGVTGCSLLDLA